MAGLAHRGETRFAPQFDVLWLLRLCRRRWPILVGAVALGLAVASLYLGMAPRRYTASVQILVDTRRNEVLLRQDAPDDRQLDPGLVESQVEILKSDNVARSVVHDLKLANDPDFMKGRGLPFRLASVIRPTPGPQDPEEAAVDRLTAGVRAKRIGATYVIQLDYAGADPTTAARIANALSEAYTLGEVEARFQSTRRTGRWFEDRMNELRAQSTSADLAVQKFKEDNNIVDTSRGLMSEQQLGDVSAQLVAAGAATVEAKARYDRVRKVLDGDIADATVADALRSEVITRLRARYLDLSAREADLAARYGEDHRAVFDLRTQMTGIERAAREELKRVAESARSDYEIAETRERSLRTSLDQLVAQTGAVNEAQVRLRDLESSARSYRGLYDDFLRMFRKATQDQTFPVVNARVITPARVPAEPSSPKPLAVYAASLALGAVLGFGTMLGRELLGGGFRTPDDIILHAGLECLGSLPNITADGGRLRAPRSAPPIDGVLGGTAPIMRHAVAAPFSRFAETVRNAKVSIDIARAASRSCVVGIISSVPGEGKTTFASNLALLTAQMGHRTLLIDGDMHNPSLSRTLRPDQPFGLIELLTGRASLGEVMRSDAATGLDFLPTVVDERQANVVALLASPLMRKLIEKARGRYEYVYIDLPPVVPMVDVKASTSMFDSYVLVVEWGATSRDAVRDAMIHVGEARQRVVGAVLSKADPAELKRLEAYRGASCAGYHIEAGTA